MDRHGPWCFRVVFLCIALMVGSRNFVLATPLELRALKVAYIYNLAKFTRWPSSIWSNPNSPFVFCAYGDGEVSDELQRLQDKEIGGHPIRILKLDNEVDFKQCNALYIEPSERRRYRYLLSLLDSDKVLTISEDSSFLRNGGLVTLAEKDQRLRFEINMLKLSDSELKLSSKLLKIAFLVDNPR